MASLHSCCQETSQGLLAKVEEIVEKAKSKIVAEKAISSALQLEVTKLKNVIALNKKNALKLRADLGDMMKVKQALEKKVTDLQQAALDSCSSPKGLLSVVFCRSPHSHPFPSHLSQVASTCRQQWVDKFPGHNLTYGFSGKHAYGEFSFFVMAKTCYVISSELLRQRKPLMPGDVLLDWGCGSGKWLCFARKLLGVPNMIALGIEAEQRILDVCKNNLAAFNTCRCSVVLEKSERFASFCPARVVVNYDGGIQSMQSNANGKIHRTIMRTAFCSPSVDVVVSTRLNWNTFWTYFSKHLDKLCGSLWKCVHIDECSFGRSKYSVNVWFRTSPMQPSSKQMHNIVDNRMHKLLEGSFSCCSLET